MQPGCHPGGGNRGCDQKCQQTEQSIRHGLLAHPFTVDDDNGFVADGSDGTGIEVIVAAFQSQFGGETDAFDAAGFDLFSAHQFDGDGASGAVHGEITGDFISAINGFDFCAAKFDGRELFGVEVIGLSQMFVTGGIGGIDTVGFDGELEAGFRRILSIDGEFPIHFIEPSVDPADVEVASFEADRGVNGIVDVFFGGCGSCGQQADGEQQECREETHG